MFNSVLVYFDTVSWENDLEILCFGLRDRQQNYNMQNIKISTIQFENKDYNLSIIEKLSKKAAFTGAFLEQLNTLEEFVHLIGVNTKKEKNKVRKLIGTNSKKTYRKAQKSFRD